MKQNITCFLLLVLFLSAVLSCSKKPKTSSFKSPPSQKEKEIKVEKNTQIKDFQKAKELLKKLYKKLGEKTFYCVCDYDLEKDSRKESQIDFESCGYEIHKLFEQRAYRVEWEHVVPASAIGSHFKEWKQGHPECISQGKPYKGRKCLSKVNPTFRLIEADIYNLVPAIGQVNALRLNYDIGEIEGEKRHFGACDIEIDRIQRLVEPGEVLLGDVARIYMYMDITYPGYNVIHEKNKSFINEWDKKDPVSFEECDRYYHKKEVQKNENPILQESCRNLGEITQEYNP